MDSYKEGEHEIEEWPPEIEKSRPTWVDVLLGGCCAVLFVVLLILAMFLFLFPE